jgi:hypothetical protein
MDVRVAEAGDSPARIVYPKHFIGLYCGDDHCRGSEQMSITIKPSSFV